MRSFDILMITFLFCIRAFGWQAPKFGHLPHILDSDGAKLSKRHNHANVDYYKDLGILPQALNNFITFNSSGFDWDNDSLGKSHSMNDMINSVRIFHIYMQVLRTYVFIFHRSLLAVRHKESENSCFPTTNTRSSGLQSIRNSKTNQ